MSVYRMWPGRTPLGQVPAVLALPTDSSSSTVVLGSVVIQTSGYLVVASADPTAVVGVALQAYNTNPGFDAANSPSPSTGRSATVSCAMANTITEFVAKLTNSSSTRIAPVAADVGTSVGITAYSGIWTVDKGKTGGSARVLITGIDIPNEFVYFRWLAAAITE